MIWSGLPPSPEDALSAYDVDAVLHTTALSTHLSSSSVPQNATIHAIADQVTASTPFPTHATLDLSLVKPAIERSRVVKDAYEVALIRRANAVSSAAHAAALRAARTARSERELQAAFLERCVALGCPQQAYAGIFAAGTNAATLHYVRNDEPLQARLNVLLDAAAEERCYAADVTRTFPISGTFSRESAAVYGIVLEMQTKCIEALKGGVVWDEMHVLAHRILIRGLLGLGLLKGGTEGEILEARTSVAFLPHGLGHYLGMDTHDTGGNANYQDKDPIFRYLRVRGKVPAGAVITVEPGCYFCRFILEPYLKDEKHGKYIDEEVLERYWSVGGVRIEGELSILSCTSERVLPCLPVPKHTKLSNTVIDDILVTESGTENLTPAPKSIDEMSQIYHGQA